MFYLGGDKNLILFLSLDGQEMHVCYGILQVGAVAETWKVSTLIQVVHFFQGTNANRGEKNNSKYSDLAALFQVFGKESFH